MLRDYDKRKIEIQDYEKGKKCLGQHNKGKVSKNYPFYSK